jgi:ABC-2 type transport system permease protein
MRELWILTRKDLLLYLRSPLTFVLLLIVPLILIVLMSTALEGLLTGEGRLRISVVDLDQTEESRAFVSSLREIEDVSVRLESPGSHRLDADDAAAYLDRGKRLMVLVIPEGYADAVSKGTPAEVLTYSDPAQPRFAAFVRSGVLARFNEQHGRGSLAGVEVRREALVEGTSLPSAFEQTVPGFTVMYSVYVGGLLATFVAFEKRTHRTWDRLLVAPLPRRTILLAKLFAAYAVGVAQMALLLAVGRLAFGMELSNFGGVSLVALVYLFTPVSLGVLIASFVDEFRAVTSLENLIAVTLAAIGGSLVPIFLLPAWMEAIAVFTPHYWALDALQDLMFRGAAVADVAQNLLVLILFATAIFIAGVARFKFEPRGTEA